MIDVTHPKNGYFQLCEILQFTLDGFDSGLLWVNLAAGMGLWFHDTSVDLTRLMTPALG
jgi:hypothetical protein